MNLGAFSVSLSVKDIEASNAFYEKLGFKRFGGDIRQKWLILKNGDHLIGLFEGMFEGNMLTFNPGWNQAAEELEAFEDVRVIQENLEADGVDVESKIDPSSKGPASFSVPDPDGNRILFDQHR